MLVLCDLDGVLADFSRAACVLHGRPTYAVTKWNWYTDWGMDSYEFWAPIKDAGVGFYNSFVRPTPWCRELYDYLRLNYPMIIATATPLHPGLICGKAKWIEDILSPHPPVHFGNDKSLMAAPDRVLIDDRNENVNAFRDAGGHAITFPQPWNVMHKMTKHRVQYVKDCLESIERQKAA